jgi:hypothetical protein
MNSAKEVSRRGMLVKIRLLFNGAVGIVLAIPVVPYILSPVIRERRPGAESWLSLCTLWQFPEGETRLATFRHPAVNPSDGETGNFPCWVRRVGGEKFQCSRSIARIWGARFAGFHSRVCSCAHATAASTIRTARAPPGRRSAACLNTATR